MSNEKRGDVMFVRRYFSYGQMCQQFTQPNMHGQWATLSDERPTLAEYVLKAHFMLKVPDEDSMVRVKRYSDLQKSLLTLTWALGVPVATELLWIGCTPVLNNLIDIDRYLFSHPHTFNQFDLQVVVALTAIKGIAFDQTFERPDTATRRIIDTMTLPESMKDNMKQTAINAGLRCAIDYD